MFIKFILPFPTLWCLSKDENVDFFYHFRVPHKVQISLIFFASLLLKTSLILSVSRSFHKEWSDRDCCCKWRRAAEKRACCRSPDAQSLLRMAPRTQLVFFCGIVVGSLLAASFRMVSNLDVAESKFRRRGTPEDQETGNPTKDISITDNSKPTSIENQSALQRNEMVAINFADQSRLYQHDPVFLSMPDLLPNTQA